MAPDLIVSRHLQTLSSNSPGRKNAGIFQKFVKNFRDITNFSVNAEKI